MTPFSGTADPGTADLDEATAAASETCSSPAILGALFIYFAVALTTSALLEPIVAFFVRAGADPLMAVLSQVTATLLVLIYAAGWVVEGLRIPSRTGPRLVVGVGAMALLVASGFALTALILGV